MSSLTDNLAIGEWIEKWNELVFFQPDDDLSAKTLSETIDANVTVKYVGSLTSTSHLLVSILSYSIRINHDVHDINGLKGGVQMVRSMFTTSLKSNEELIHWDAADGVGGAAVHKTVFTSEDKASGKIVTKTSLVTTLVKKIDGKRKVSELVEVEVEHE